MIFPAFISMLFTFAFNFYLNSCLYETAPDFPFEYFPFC